jgi:hypothetical protein
MLALSCNGVPCVNIEKRGMHYWEPLTSLSTQNWKIYRNNINGELGKFVEKTNKKYKDIINKERKFVDETKSLFYKLYKNLSQEEKRVFLKENSTSWLSKETCSVCLNKCSKKNKCVHYDCEGMCDNCFKNKLDTEHKCKACKKTQDIQCPICFTEKPLSDMCKSKSCCHYVCWSCYGRAFHSGNPIYNCPTCRGEFSENQFVDSSSEYDSEYDNDEIEDLDTLDLTDEIMNPEQMEILLTSLLEVDTSQSTFV